MGGLVALALCVAACTPSFDVKVCDTGADCAPTERCLTGLCTRLRSLPQLDVSGAASLVLTFGGVPGRSRALATNADESLDASLTVLGISISAEASVHALVYSCSLDDLEIEKGEVFAGADLPMPGAAFVFDMTSNTWTEQPPDAVAAAVVRDPGLSFDFDPCPQYELVATATTSLLREPWVVELADGTVAVASPGAPLVVYSEGRVRSFPDVRLACAGGDGDQAWALDLAGCPGRLEPGPQFLRDESLPCHPTVASGECLNIAAKPGTGELVATTRPARATRVDGAHWVDLIDPLVFPSPTRGWFTIDRSASEIVFAYWHSMTVHGATYRWAGGASELVHLPMALEDTYAITALPTGDFILGTDGFNLVTLHLFRSGTFVRVGEILDEDLRSITPARAGFLVSTNYGVRHFAAGRDCGVLPLEGATRAIETATGITAVRWEPEGLGLAAYRRTRRARGCFPRDLPAR